MTKDSLKGNPFLSEVELEAKAKSVTLCDTANKLRETGIPKPSEPSKIPDLKVGYTPEGKGIHQHH